MTKISGMGEAPRLVAHLPVAENQEIAPCQSEAAEGDFAGQVKHRLGSRVQACLLI